MANGLMNKSNQPISDAAMEESAGRRTRLLNGAVVHYVFYYCLFSGITKDQYETKTFILDCYIIGR